MAEPVELRREALLPVALVRWSEQGTRRILVLWLGLFLSQAVLYWPALCGTKILLPLDVLQREKFYLPVPLEFQPFAAENAVLADEITVFEPFRRFAVEEVRAGRLPLWNPYNFCGAPFLAANQPALFSPFHVLDYLFPGTWVIAWNQLLKSLVAGTGAYLFFRRTLGVGFWPAAVGAWCFPLGGFMMQWQGYTLTHVLAWFPWMLLATDATIRRPWSWATLGLALATGAMLVSGHAAMAAQALLVVGPFAVWRIVAEYRQHHRALWHMFVAALALTAGWTLGAIVSAPQSLPTVAYMRDSYRLATRQTGFDEAPGVGLMALPQFLIPDFHGSERKYDVFLYNGNRLESAASGYVGAWLTLFLAPLGWQKRRQRGAFIFWLVAGLLGASQLLDIPLLRGLFDLFPFTLLRNNRYVFLTGWAILTMGVLGLDALVERQATWRTWCWIPLGVSLLFGLWCGWRFLHPVEIIAKAAGSPAYYRFLVTAAAGVLICTASIALWNMLRVDAWDNPAMIVLLSLLVIGEPLWFFYGFNPQLGAELDYPDLPALAAIRQAGPGRICGTHCLFPSINLVSRLPDIRGYDGVDPTEYVELVGCSYAVDEPWLVDPSSMTAYFEVHQSPILDLLNLRYDIRRGVPTGGVKPIFVGDDYFVVENKACLPRAFVPRHVEVVADKAERLRLLSEADFSPREVAYSEIALDLTEPAAGSADFVAELPNELTLAVDMQTPGCLVVADCWAPGWRAWLDGEELPVLRVNHALRGVVLPSGTGTLVMRYEPREFYLGLRIAAMAIVLMLSWAIALLAGGFIRRRRAAA